MRDRTLAAAAIAMVAVGLLSCDHSPTMPRLDQLALDVVSGDGQTAVVGTQLAPLIVKVTSGGNPVAQQVLNFRVVTGGGSVYGGAELTDNDGIAQELWTLGTDASQPQRLEVRAVESSTGAEKVYGVFTATALPGPVAQIVIQAGNGQSAHPGELVPIAPAVRVTDQYGNPVPSTAVAFAPRGGSGSVTGATPTTNASGIATVGSWTIGSACARTDTLMATGTGGAIAGNPATFVAGTRDCWTTESSMTYARQLMAGGVMNGALYAVGGSLDAADQNKTSIVEAFVPGTGWTTKAQMQIAHVLPGVGVVNSVLYVMGGGEFDHSLVEAYEPTENAWTTKAPMPTGRGGAAVAAVGGVIYAAGGNDSQRGVDSIVEAYDAASDTWTTRAPMRTARYIPGVGVVNGIIYVLGGAGSDNTFLASVEAYDPMTNTWTTKRPMPTPRYGLGVAVIDGILYAVGGYNDNSGFQNTIEAYDPATDTWTTRAPMLTAKYTAAVGAINGVLFAAGGFETGSVVVATTEAYHP
jgi:hypothetical protein